MQNIEKFFGYRVKLMDELDPVRIEILKEKAEKIRALNDFSDDEYVVYFHQMSLEPVDEHFSEPLRIEERIKRLDLKFSVNPKQVRNGKIKLYNFLLDDEIKKEVKEIRNADSINYMIQGDALIDRYGFRNEIVTFVDKTLRVDHRKLKVSVTCKPTDTLMELLTQKIDSHLTQIDFQLESKKIKLRDIKPNANSKQVTGVPQVTHQVIYNNYGQVGAQGENATSNSNTFNQQNISVDFDALSSELSQLRAALKLNAETDNREHDKAIGAITEAEEAAQNKDLNKTLEHVKTAGKWAYSISEKIGVGLLIALIKTHLGW